MKKNTYALIIMDGFAWGENIPGNAIKNQGTKNLKELAKHFPSATLKASGFDVGLPDGQMGNSEVGHLNIGAGRVVYQDISRIDKSIADGDFFANPALTGAVANAKNNGTKLHLVGLLSDGGVHSHINHLYALLKLAKESGLKKVYVHCLMDGRDVSPTSGASFVSALQQKMKEIGVGKIGSVVGRYYFMDRDNRWERVEQGYNCMAAATGKHTSDPVKTINENYAAGITDEFCPPLNITYDGKVESEVCADDSIVFFNFRSDRAREVTKAFIDKDFDSFKRVKGYTPTFYVGMTQYDANFKNIHTAFAPKELTNTFGEYMAKLGKTQLRIAETEKYAHVTFFFNGGIEAPNPGEKRILIPSPKVATYDSKPEMSAYEVTDSVIAEIEKGETDVVILNFANCDMVGHTGIEPAVIKAVAAVDDCVKRVVDAVLSTGGAAIISADHGNAEQLLMPDGSPCTAHTTNDVPVIVACPKLIGAKLRKDGKISDLIPTLLKIMDIPKPVEMEGESLV